MCSSHWPLQPPRRHWTNALQQGLSWTLHGEISLKLECQLKHHFYGKAKPGYNVVQNANFVWIFKDIVMCWPLWTTASEGCGGCFAPAMPFLGVRIWIQIMMWVFFLTPPSSWLSSDAVHLERASGPTGEGLSPTDHPLPPPLQTPVRSPGGHLCF